MIKRLIKYLAYKFYAIGKIEYGQRLPSIIKENYKKICTLQQEVVLGNDAVIINPQQDSSKITIGNYSVVYGELMVDKNGGSIQIGEHCFIGKDSRIWSLSRISIGNRVLISHNVNIHDNDSHSLVANERHLEFLSIFQNKQDKNPPLIDSASIVIEDDVWIGFNATILKGVKIGRGAIVASNALVCKDVEPYTVVISENNNRVIKKTT